MSIDVWMQRAADDAMLFSNCVKAEFGAGIPKLLVDAIARISWAASADLLHGIAGRTWCCTSPPLPGDTVFGMLWVAASALVDSRLQLVDGYGLTWRATSLPAYYRPTVMSPTDYSAALANFPEEDVRVVTPSLPYSYDELCAMFAWHAAAGSPCTAQGTIVRVLGLHAMSWYTAPTFTKIT